MAEKNPYDLAGDAATQLNETLGEKAGAHKAALVLGSGWANALSELGEQTAEVEAHTLPGFIAPTVAGHGSKILSIDTGDNKVMVFQGRTHLYEGHSGVDVTHGVRTAWAAGCEVIILTNASGGVNPDYEPGQPVLISDHINMTGTSPLAGPAPPKELGIRFVDLSEAYSKRLRELTKEIAPDLTEGVYAGFMGPHYETPAEVQMAKTMGADMVGMSTVLECIAARYLKLEVLGISLVTNMAAGVSDELLDHEDVLAVGKQSSKRVGTILNGVINRL